MTARQTLLEQDPACTAIAGHRRYRHEASRSTRASVLLHFPAERLGTALEAVERALSGLQGVERVERGEKLREVMLVDYDTGRVSADEILAACREELAHCDAARRKARSARPLLPLLFPSARPAQRLFG